MRLSTEEYFLEIALKVSERATCGRGRKVGCVLVNENGYIRATGYNGVPKGFTHCLDEPCPGASFPGDPNSLSQCYAVHAEANALLQLEGDKEKVTTAYTTCSPCRECAKLFANSFVKRIFCLEIYNDRVAEEILEKAGIEVVILGENNVFDQ